MIAGTIIGYKEYRLLVGFMKTFDGSQKLIQIIWSVFYILIVGGHCSVKLNAFFLLCKFVTDCKAPCICCI